MRFCCWGVLVIYSTSADACCAPFWRGGALDTACSHELADRRSMHLATKRLFIGHVWVAPIAKCLPDAGKPRENSIFETRWATTILQSLCKSSTKPSRCAFAER